MPKGRFASASDIASTAKCCLHVYRTRHDERRQEARTVVLLVWVVVVFVLAWLPLNSLNVMLDLGLYPTLFR